MTDNELKISIRLLEGLTDKRLAHGELWDSELGCGCVQGMICPKELWPVNHGTLIWTDEDDGSVNFYLPGVGRWAREVGLRALALLELERVNDANPKETPEARYERVLAHLKEELRKWDDN